MLFITFWALVLWQPVTAICKFYRDARYESSEGKIKVKRRKEKRYVDLAASRGELIEVSIEAVFEPMVQGYIIFPSIIDIIERLAHSIKVEADGTFKISFLLKGIETAQIFSIGISMVSLAWCYSEYNSVRKNMLLDITVSPCSRIIMFFYMLLQVIARLLAFMLFTLYWGPGNFYPLMIFIFIHMIIAAGIHVIFSEDWAFWNTGQYLKFCHNVMMNAFASIYFHNYLRFDEMPKEMERKGEEFIDSQRPGLHISTFLRQLTFDTLYALEFVILLAFGFSSKVQDLTEHKPVLISVILSLYVISVFFRLFYYIFMHVWRNVILTGKRLIRQEIEDIDTMDNATGANIQKKFFKYVFISRNTWILGSLKHIETTLIVLPKRIIEAIKGRGEDLEHSFAGGTRQNPLECLNPRKLNNLVKSLMFFPIVILIIVLNVIVILMLLVGLVMTIPIAVLVFLYNIKNGFRAVDLEQGLDANDSNCNIDGANILELPPEIESGESPLFQCDPKRKTLAKFQEDLAEDNGVIDLSRHLEVTADEFEMFSVILLSLNRKKYPMKLLILDNCELTDDKLEKLTPLIIKFDRVTMNGSQKMTSLGLDILGKGIRSPGCRLKKLELKVAKHDEATIRFRREILLEEFKGLTITMTSEALSKVACFMPFLEEIYLDDVFNDNIFTEMLNKTRQDNLVNAWKIVGKKISECPISELKLRYLSLPGCAINDEILSILSPALVKIKIIHLGRNSISPNGWQNLAQEMNKNENTILTHLSLSTIIHNDKNMIGLATKNIHVPAMEHLTHLALKMEEVDFSGQHDIGIEGWHVFADITNKTLEETPNCVKLKSIKFKACRIKADTRELLIDTFERHHNVISVPKLEFGQDSFDESDRKGKSYLCKSCC